MLNIHFVELETLMLGSGLKRRIQGFGNKWAWWPSWSCDRDHLPNINFHYPFTLRFHMKSEFNYTANKPLNA